MFKNNPQLSALALLVQKFGERIPGGGFEVHVTAAEKMAISPYGIFQEVPDGILGTKWQYFPNPVLDIEGHAVPDEEIPSYRLGHIWEENLGTRGANCALCYVEQSDENRNENCAKRPEYEQKLIK